MTIGIEQRTRLVYEAYVCQDLRDPSQSLLLSLSSKIAARKST